METIRITILNSKVMPLLESLEELGLISIIREVENPPVAVRKIELLKHLNTIIAEDQEVLKRLVD